MQLSSATQPTGAAFHGTQQDQPRLALIKRSNRQTRCSYLLPTLPTPAPCNPLAGTPFLLPLSCRRRYDSHRDQILRSGERHQAGGGAEFAPGQRPDDEPDLYQFFTASCFSGFGDGPKVGLWLLVDCLHLYQLISKKACSDIGTICACVSRRVSV